MDFDRLYKGQVVKFGPRVKEFVNFDPDFMTTLEAGDSLDCILQIESVDKYSATFSCLHGCGNHSFTEICIYDYESWSRQLGGSLFVESSMVECFMSKDPTCIRDVYEFDLAEETKNILEMLSEEAGG